MAAKKNNKKNISLDDRLLKNSMSQMATMLGFSQEFGVQLSQTATLMKNNRNYFISNDWPTLTYAYTTHGVIQTLIDQPIEDAYRGGFEIESGELDAENIRDINAYIKDNNIIQELIDLGKWDRLYGGGAMIINTIGKANSPLNVNAINKYSMLEFYAADLWELNKTNSQRYAEKKPYVKTGIEDKFFVYGQEIDKTRLLITKGKRAPSLARMQLRGWGMSVIERSIRSINQYLKNQDLIFELLDEAKIDVFGIEGLNQSLINPQTTDNVVKQLQLTNRTKNYNHAIVKDNLDTYEQKQMNFTGLSEMLQQIRIQIAADLKMPLTKIFGLSASGFNSGEDDIENYNSMIESEIRGKYDHIIIQIVKLISQKLFGFIPEDVNIKYPALRMLSAEQEENVKGAKLNNTLSLYDRGLITSNEVIEEVNMQEIFRNELKGDSKDFPLPPPSKPKLDLDTTTTD